MLSGWTLWNILFVTTTIYVLHLRRRENNQKRSIKQWLAWNNKVSKADKKPHGKQATTSPVATTNPKQLLEDSPTTTTL
jgi:hypothetical protein